MKAEKALPFLVGDSLMFSVVGGVSPLPQLN